MTSSIAADSRHSNKKRLLLCTDLDRTLLPNGPQEESTNARVLFAHLVSLPPITLAYVTGRDIQLVTTAIEEYQLPTPDFVIGDVGSSIFRRVAGQWLHNAAWQQYLQDDWPDRTWETLAERLQPVVGITLQEPEKQAPFKLSYYLKPESSYLTVVDDIESALRTNRVAAKVIFSRDEDGCGLIDVLPSRADKYQAIVFLAQHLGFALDEGMFAGDSGTDLEVLSSPINAVLVANSDLAVQKLAKDEAMARGNSDTLFLAKGDFFGLNGNYSAGIVEGVVHYRPDLTDNLQEGFRLMTKS